MLEFVDIHHAFGDRGILSGINMTAAPGEITCLLGPSGCGKTTLLRLTAGLYDVQRGEIRLGGTPLATRKLSPPPEKRPVGLVFQEGALFPHLNVAENIGFGVKDPGLRSERVQALLTQIGLPGSEKAYPHTLSGGQQQRVALARALAPEPRVLLLDEPFASVDIVLRRALREETRRLLRERNTVAILVTHDPEEALEIADRIAVMGEGMIRQFGAPGEIYNRPVNADVAAMFGQGAVLGGERTDGGVTTPFGLWPEDAFTLPLPASRRVEIVARPEALVVREGDDARIEDIRLQGPSLRIVVASPGGVRLSALMPAGGSFSAGQSVSVVPRKASLFAYPENPGRSG